MFPYPNLSSVLIEETRVGYTIVRICQSAVGGFEVVVLQDTLRDLNGREVHRYDTLAEAFTAKRRLLEIFRAMCPEFSGGQLDELEAAGYVSPEHRWDHNQPAPKHAFELATRITGRRSQLQVVKS